MKTTEKKLPAKKKSAAKPKALFERVSLPSVEEGTDYLLLVPSDDDGLPKFRHTVATYAFDGRFHEHRRKNERSAPRSFAFSDIKKIYRLPDCE